MSPETIEWARAQFTIVVQALLDDPHGVLDGQVADVPDYVAQLRRIGAELGVSFDAVVREQGKPKEIARLVQLGGGRRGENG